MVRVLHRHLETNKETLVQVLEYGYVRLEDVGLERSTFKAIYTPNNFQ
jgi:hypothetical protein